MSAGGWRTPAFFLVAACFFIQAALVWLDVGAHPGSTIAMDASAREGQTIFRTHGCQSCHALFGMGGFLGPDLTNAARRVPPERYSQLLQEGSGPMPAYHLNSHQRDAVFAYLQALDATGQGTPLPPMPDAGPLFSAGLARWSAQGRALTDPVRQGADVVMKGSCGACHRSFAVDAAIRAPDLSLARGHLDEESVRRVLLHGRGIMPATGLSTDQAESVIAFLDFLATNRDAIVPRQTSVMSHLPWFEYQKEVPSSAPTPGKAP